MWDWLWLDGASLIWWLPMYFWWSLCHYIIARKTDTQSAWLVWIPIVKFYLICKIAGQSGWWFFLFFIPLVNIIVYIFVWMNIAETCNRPTWLGIFMIVPGVNLIILGVLALGE